MVASDITVIVPTLNEERTIGVLLNVLSRMYPGIVIIVVDDVSTDATCTIVEELVQSNREDQKIKLLVRHNATHRGITASVLDAVREVKTDYFIVMDGDLQHPPEALAEIMSALYDGADIVSASRQNLVVRQHPLRMFITWVSTVIAKLVLLRRGFRISDPMSGLFGTRAALFKQVMETSLKRFEPAGYKIMFDYLRCLSADVKVEEVLYDFNLRPYGASKLRPVHAYYFLRSVLK